MLRLTCTTNHRWGLVIAEQVTPLSWRGQVILVEAPVTNLVSQGETIAAFAVRVLVRIEAFVNENLPVFGP